VLLVNLWVVCDVCDCYGKKFFLDVCCFVENVLVWFVVVVVGFELECFCYYVLFGVVVIMYFMIVMIVW